MAVQPEYNEIVAGALWVGSHPERSGPLGAVLTELASRGVGGVVTLTERGLDPAALSAAGLTGLHLPVENYTAPSSAQLEEGVAFIDACRGRGKVALAHCFAGVGRAGTLGAAYLIAQGRGVEQAVQEMRRLRHRSCVETQSQYEALVAYAASLGR